MDKSETYIKMRLAAINYLAMGKPPKSFVHWLTDKIFVDTEGDFYYSDEEATCQLERQDQLQAMVLPDPNRKDAWGDSWPLDPKDDDVAWLFFDFCEQVQERKYSQQTGEQLWLRYVMKEKYNKIWDGEEWTQ